MSGLAEPAAGLAVLLSLALFGARRAGTVTILCALQALLASAALAACLPLALAILLFNGIALPIAVRHVVGRRPPAWRGDRRRVGISAWLAASALLVVAIAAAHRMQDGVVPALGLAIAWLGLLFVGSGPRGASRALGLLSSQNGIALVAGSLPGTPVPTLVAVSLPFVPALILAETWLRR